MKPFRVLLAGLVHDHVWRMIPDFAKIPGVKIVGGADPNKPLREKLRKEFGVKTLFERPTDLFDSEDAVAVMVGCAAAVGVESVGIAAERGLRGFVDKPKAHTS